MAESKKGTSSTDSKDKISFLDDDIGKDFLSWKSMPLAKGDAMDFGFDTVQSGKKNKFQFDNLDMDFNLDAGFDKLSSFKVDMADLDFSGSPKKSAKPKEKSKTETVGETDHAKQNDFDFSFDFDDMDGFNFNTSSKKAEKISKKRSENERKDLDVNDDQCYKTHPIGPCMVDVASTAKHIDSENKDTSNAENLLGGKGACNLINDVCLSKSIIAGSISVPHGHKIGPEKKVSSSSSTEETCQQCPPEKSISTELCVQEMQHSPVKSVSTDEPTQVAVSDMVADVSDMQADVSSQNTDVDRTCGGVSNDEMDSGLRSKLERIKRKEASSLCIAESESEQGEQEKSASYALPVDNMDVSEPARNDHKDTSTERLMGNRMHGTGANRDVLSSAAKLPMFPSASESLIDKLMLRKEKDGLVDKLALMKEKEGSVDKLIPEKEKEGAGIRTESFNKTKESEHWLPQSSFAGTKDSSVEKNNLLVVNSCPENEKRLCSNHVNAQFRTQFVSNDAWGSRKPIQSESVLLGNEKNGKNLTNMGENFKCDDVESGVKLKAGSKPQREEVTKGDFALRGSKRNTNQTSANPRLSKSSTTAILNSKTVSGEGSKTSKRIPELSSLRNLRIAKTNNDLLNSTLQKDSLKIVDQKVEVPVQTSSSIAHPVGSRGKNTPPTSLKRKAFEDSNMDLVSLKPLKRLSQSPTESRNVKVASPVIIDKEVNNHEIRPIDKTNDGLNDHQSPRLELTAEVGMAELENPLVMENDGNVERAEAYTKELEDICIMLKKKHEEAKEIMVRAVVNNNNLLMLNHPIYQQKIRMIQDFAARLTFKELPA